MVVVFVVGVVLFWYVRLLLMILYRVMLFWVWVVVVVVRFIVVMVKVMCFFIDFLFLKNDFFFGVVL